MPYDPKFGLQAQTPGQRTLVLHRMKAANPTHYSRITAYEQQLYTRYIAGELSWAQVMTLRAAQ